MLSSYLFALNVAGVPLEEARTAATTVLIAVGLYLVVALEAAPGTQTHVGGRARRRARR